jgi:hypothetical protein
MATTLFRTSAMRSAARAAPSMRASIGGTTFVRGKATLPDLSCMSRTEMEYTYRRAQNTTNIIPHLRRLRRP